MKLSQLAAKPELIKLTIDNEEIVKEYGEPLEFYTWDRQPLDVFMRLAVSTENMESVVDVVRTLILDEEGNAIIDDKTMLPSKVLISAIGKIVETLGK